MSYVELFVPMAAFVMITAVVAHICRLIGTGMMHKTIREALRTQPEAVPQLLPCLNRPAPWSDAVLGWIFLALALALALFSATEPDDQSRAEILRATIIPAVVGAAVLAYAWWSGRRER